MNAPSIASSGTAAAATARFTVEDLVGLTKPDGAFQLNSSKSLALWAASRYDFKAAEGVGRTEKALHLVDLKGEKGLHKILLAGLASTEAVWLDAKTVLYTRPPGSTHADVDHSSTRSDEDQAAHLKKRVEEHGEGVELWAKDVETSANYKLASLPVA